jgi:hypothetical protein
MTPNDTNKPETQNEASAARCAVASGSPPFSVHVVRRKKGTKRERAYVAKYQGREIGITAFTSDYDRPQDAADDVVERAWIWVRSRPHTRAIKFILGSEI